MAGRAAAEKSKDCEYRWCAYLATCRNYVYASFPEGSGRSRGLDVFSLCLRRARWGGVEVHCTRQVELALFGSWGFGFVKVDRVYAQSWLNSFDS